jgi:hypothetical protein
LDGTLVPVADRFYDPQNYSGKHRRIGRNLQIVSDVRGELLIVGPIQPGRLHDRRALAESGLEPALCQPRLLVHADRGYTGTEFITPVKSSRHHPLTLADRVENREISGIRNAVDRSIAHLKILAILRTGIRTRSTDRAATITEIIEVAVGLCFFRQEWSHS